jgi:HK97 family phage prohead protease
MNSLPEYRISPKRLAPVWVENRAAGKKAIVGYGAVFYSDTDPGTEYWLWGDVVERISPGAFDRALKERHDARGLFNHDPSNLLGRVTNGTMRLSVDRKGLKSLLSGYKSKSTNWLGLGVFSFG